MKKKYLYLMAISGGIFFLTGLMAGDVGRIPECGSNMVLQKHHVILFFAMLTFAAFGCWQAGRAWEKDK